MKYHNCCESQPNNVKISSKLDERGLHSGRQISPQNSTQEHAEQRRNKKELQIKMHEEQL